MRVQLPSFVIVTSLLLPQTAARTRPPDTELKALVTRQYVALNERNFSAMRDLYDDRSEGAFFPPAGPPQTGVSAYLQALTDFRAQFQSFSWSARNIAVASLAPTVATTTVVFHGEGMLPDGGKPIAIDGRQTGVWQRRANDWRMIHEHWSAPWTLPAQAPAAPAENGAETAAELLKAYEDAWSSGDAGALAALWTEDGDIGTLGSASPTRGRQAVSDFWTQAIARRRSPTLVHATASNARGISPDVIVADGAFEYRPKSAAASSPAASVDRFALVLRRSQGAWRIAELRIAGGR